MLTMMREQTSAALDLLRRNKIGRVGFARQGRAVILPVTYAVEEDGSILFRTTTGSKLMTAETEISPVAFEVDELDPETGMAQAVIVRGPMDEVLDAVERTRLARTVSLAPWANGVTRDNWVRISPTTIEFWKDGE